LVCPCAVFVKAAKVANKKNAKATAFAVARLPA
jgi:hypothetical protein